ncbi:Glucosamine 6-phosphate N-acetyltransferase [Acorus gramineus]|uniref:Glucosamine 6-phosphate N-acetyltransferase n=1 Tax=Acorus gramineus TaxID=55184 RepID=A0AAV9A5D6_ACOGR|nr:Glucosamine 6-phosphate N-acetyltransferase [Acorus gramineus]
MADREIVDDESDPFEIRRLGITDNQKGFVDLLNQLTTVGSVTDAEFRSRFEDLAALGDDHVVCVVEDRRSGRIVGTGSVFVEKKFIHRCGSVGHVEDVVVDSAARGWRLGRRIVGFLSDHARSVGCYKVILDCTAEMRGFYERCGFVEKNVQMAMYF